MLRLTVLFATMSWFAIPAWAHEGGERIGAGAMWNVEPWLLLCLLASAGLYATGVYRLWAKAGRGRGITRGQAARFGLGWMTLVVALVSPIDRIAAAFFWVHMVQHELLMVVAAPLLVLSRPLEAWTWALRSEWRRPVGHVVRRSWLRTAWSLTHAGPAWLLHAAVLWGWHAPPLFQAALASQPIHILQHASFLASALLFWWSVFGRGVREPGGTSLASLFTTMLHTGALGALLTFSRTVWYPAYGAAHGAAAGFDLLADQQLGGLVMWVPAGTVYIGVALMIAARWLQLPQMARR